MRLSAKPIINFANVNLFSYAIEWNVRAGDANTLYFQLIDLDQTIVTGAPGLGYKTSGQLGSISASMPSLRYMTGVSATPVTVTVTFPSIDSSKVQTFTASQASAADPSIWSISIPSSFTPNSGNVLFSVTEGSNTKTFSVMNMIVVEFPGADGCDGTIPNTSNGEFQ